MEQDQRAALRHSLAKVVPWSSWLPEAAATLVQEAAAGGRAGWAAFLRGGPPEVVAAVQGVLGELLVAEARRQGEARARNTAGTAAGGAPMHSSPGLWPRACDVFPSVEWDLEDWQAEDCPASVTAQALPLAGTTLSREDSPNNVAVSYVSDEAARTSTVNAHMREILQQLRNYQPFCEPFMRPVRRSEAPGYYEIITAPSDLQTVAATLAASGYTQAPEQFARDVLRIYSNCREYNTEPSNEYVASADRMEHLTRRLLAEMPLVLVGRAPDLVVPDGMSHHIAHRCARPAWLPSAPLEGQNPGALLAIWCAPCYGGGATTVTGSSSMCHVVVLMPVPIGPLCDAVWYAGARIRSCQRSAQRPRWRRRGGRGAAGSLGLRR